VNGQILDVTEYLAIHPGGKKSILLYAGQDATDVYNLFHKESATLGLAQRQIVGELEKIAPKL